ncbi:MAG: F0F1-type ATP synthase assembly protein I [Rhodococcus sp. (in: high G+C Gram-positive bacteria)]|jgi:hypothetical protein
MGGSEFGVREDRDRLLHGIEIVGTEQHGRPMPVAGYLVTGVCVRSASSTILDKLARTSATGRVVMYIIGAQLQWVMR